MLWEVKIQHSICKYTSILKGRF